MGLFGFPIKRGPSKSHARGSSRAPQLVPAAPAAVKPPPRTTPSAAGNAHALEAATTPDDFWTIDEEALFHPSGDTYYQISTDVFFNARHSVSFSGRAGPEHTHSFRLQATCQTQGLDREDQVVIGYHILRQKTTLVANAYNNHLLNTLPPFRQLQPTTEVLTAILFQQIDRLLADLGLALMSVTLWESPTEAITYGRHGRGPA